MEIGRCTSKIRSVMLTMILALIMIMMFKPPVAVQASEAGIPSANTIVDGIGSNGAGGKGKIKGGILYTRTGYLCYVLQENGDTIPGMQAKAFYSPGYEELGGAQWSCHSKKGGYSANSWTAVSPWPYTPFNKNDTTNVESIKSWMKKTDDGVTENGVQFVYDNWGEDIATKFTEGEYVLVVENILHFQPCIKEGSGGTIDFAGETEKQIRASLIAYYMNNSLKRDEATKKANAKIAEMKRFNHFNELVNSVKILYESKYGTIEKGASYKSVGSPIIGTCTDCINYQHQVGADADQFKSYTNGVACMAEHIEVGGIGEDAGFIAYAGAITQSTRWSDPDVQKYGIAMIVIKATDDKSIRTYWEPNGSPGKPEPSEPLKKGKCDIVKGYYEENETTGEKTPLGVFSERDTTNKIIICSEPEFELVQWDISTTFNDGLDPTSWNPPGSISRSGTTPETVKLEVPEKVVYVLLKRVIREEEEAPPEVNYIIPQSTITRRITLSKPDYQLSMPLIHEYDFVWELKEHTECAGHKYNTPCTGNHTRADGSSYNCGTDCVGNVSYCTSYYWEDDELVFSLDNVQKEAYPDILATKSGWHFVTVLNGMVQRTVDYTRTIKDVVRTEDATTNKDWDVRCVLLRGKDKLTVASWKNTDLGTEAANTDLAGVSASGFMVADTDSGDRKLADYTEVFNVDIQNLPVDNKTTWKAALGGIVDKSGNRKEPPCHTDAGVELTNPLGIAVNVLLETYSGSPDGGRNDMSCDSSVKAYAVAGYNHHNGRETPSGGQVTFRPYVQMNYDTYVEDIKTAYVLGEYDRSMTPNDYVEIAWNETGDPNLTLSSLQWSTHVRSTQLFGSGNVLLGGAALTLGIKNPDRQEMMLRTFQCIIEGKGKEQIEKAGGSDGGLMRRRR